MYAQLPLQGDMRNASIGTVGHADKEINDNIYTNINIYINMYIIHIPICRSIDVSLQLSRAALFECQNCQNSIELLSIYFLLRWEIRFLLFIVRTTRHFAIFYDNLQQAQ